VNSGIENSCVETSKVNKIVFDKQVVKICENYVLCMEQDVKIWLVQGETVIV
jgi:hypothetical protein